MLNHTSSTLKDTDDRFILPVDVETDKKQVS